MTYRMDYRRPNYDAHFGAPDTETVPARWVVERVLGEGEACLMASFKEREHATALLTMLAGTLEVERGATVEFEWFDTTGKFHAP